MVWHNKTNLIHINHEFSVSTGFYSEGKDTLSLLTAKRDWARFWKSRGLYNKMAATSLRCQIVKNTQNFFYTAMAHTSRQPIPPRSPLIWKKEHLNYKLVETKNVSLG